jgi:hypothetical protein
VQRDVGRAELGAEVVAVFPDLAGGLAGLVDVLRCLRPVVVGVMRRQPEPSTITWA